MAIIKKLISADEVPVKSINGKTGDVALTAEDVGAYNKTEIEEKLENSVADFSQNDSTQPDYIKNRTHYVEEAVVVNLEETAITTSSNMFQAQGTLSLIEGQSYTVTWEGNTYECACSSMMYYNTPALVIGNTAIMGSTVNTGEPFIIGDIPSASAYGIFVPVDGTYTVKISHKEEIVHQIDPKFVPNLPYSEGIVEIETLPETQVVISNSTYGEENRLIGFVEDETYIVIWDGVEYECVGTAGSIMGTVSTLGIGNAAFIGGEDTGEPFLIGDIPNNNAWGVFGTDGTYTVRIVQREEKVHKLEQKFTYNADWNQGDPNGEGYIENRTHYADFKGERVILADGTMTAYKVCSVSSPVDKNSVLVVVFDGVEYECEAVLENEGQVLFGNLVGIDESTPDTGEPFYAICIDNNVVVYSRNNTSSSHTISIKEKMYDVVKLHRKYLPETLSHPLKINGVTYDGSKMVDITTPTGLPSVGTSNNGAFLRVVDGQWAAVKLPNAEEGEF